MTSNYSRSGANNNNNSSKGGYAGQRRNRPADTRPSQAQRVPQGSAPQQKPAQRSAVHAASIKEREPEMKQRVTKTPSAPAAALDTRSVSPESAQEEIPVMMIRGHAVEPTLDYGLIELPPEQQEHDGHRLGQRRKQVQFGKNTDGYQIYRELVPKHERQVGNPQHPITPRINAKCPKRAWDNTIGQWRRTLHLWDERPSVAEMRKDGLPTLGELELESTTPDTGVEMKATEPAAATAAATTPATPPPKAASIARPPHTPPLVYRDPVVMQRDLQNITFSAVPRASPAPKMRPHNQPYTPKSFFGAKTASPAPNHHATEATAISNIPDYYSPTPGGLKGLRSEKDEVKPLYFY